MELDLDLAKRYTFADYIKWADERRRELFDGFIKMMTPAPKRIHQEVSARLEFNIQQYLLDKKCKMYHAPFDVRLPETKNDIEDNQIYTVVQPDICVVCDINKLDDRGCLGAPDWIIEIVSPVSAKKDLEDKFYLYEKHGVIEYWVVFPEEKSVNVFLLDNSNKYKFIGMFASDSKIKVNSLDNLYIDLEVIFRE